MSSIRPRQPGRHGALYAGRHQDHQQGAKPPLRSSTTQIAARLNPHSSLVLTPDANRRLLHAGGDFMSILLPKRWPLPIFCEEISGSGRN
jgi:hypothetical protein